MGENYPRDMTGYGRNWPHPGWPGEARIAVQFVINYEEGAENNVLHGDAASESGCTTGWLAGLGVSGICGGSSIM